MFESTLQPGALRITMSASTPNIDEAEAKLCSFVDGDLPIDRFAVRILAREALLNAVIHGSQEDSDEVVQLAVELGELGVVMTVRDHGPGFPWRELAGYVDILADGGRGIPLMHIYASAVEFNESGNEVTLLRKYETKPSRALEDGVAI